MCVIAGSKHKYERYFRDGSTFERRGQRMVRESLDESLQENVSKVEL